MAGGAWQVLKNPKLREKYDRYGNEAVHEFFDFTDYKTIDAIRIALDGDESWNAPYNLQKATTYFFAHPKLMAHFLTLDPRFSFMETARFYKGEKVRDFFLFQQKLRDSLINSYRSGGSSKDLLDTQFATEISRVIYDQSIEDFADRLELSLVINEEVIGELILKLRLFTEPIFESILDRAQFKPMRTLKYLYATAILRRGGPYLTNKMQLKIWQMLMDPPKPPDPDSLRGNSNLGDFDIGAYSDLQSSLLASLLNSPIDDYQIRKRLFEIMLLPSDPDPVFKRLEIASFFVLKGNSQEKKIAIRAIRPSLSAFYIDSSNPKNVIMSSDRSLAIRTLLKSSEFKHEALQSLQHYCDDPRISVSSKFGELEQLIYYEIFDEDVLSIYMRLLKGPLTQVKPHYFDTIYKAESHASRLEAELKDSAELLQKYIAMIPKKSSICSEIFIHSL